MEDANLESSLFLELQDLKRRLHNLETAPRLPNSAQTGGTYQLLSPNTNQEIRREGVIQFFPGGDESLPPSQTFYGIAFYDGSHNSVFMIRDDHAGLVKPGLHIPFKTPTPTVTNSGSFTVCTEWYSRKLYTNVLFIEGAVVADAATTGEMRIIDTLSSQSTAVLTVPASTNAIYSIVWLHPFGVASTGTPCFLQIQARVTSGPGNLTVYPPRYAEMVSDSLYPFAAADGDPILE